MNEWRAPWPYNSGWDDEEAESPLEFVRNTLEWIARPHGLTEKRCPKNERLSEAEDRATIALEALDHYLKEKV